MVSAEAVLRIRKKGKSGTVFEKKEQLIAGPGVIEYELSAVVPNPELWFPAGYGEQNLYELELEIRKEDTSSAFAKKTFAFRSVRIHEQRFTERQGEFRLLVNDIPVFAHGANWIPPDIIPARVTEKRIRHLLELAVLGGINYLRFWGGGYYENELFYDLCDRYGILVWQDFMFSGPEVPEFDPVFREECRQEVREVIARLSHHPSVAVWCGSNETDDYHCVNGTQHRSTFRPETHYYGWHLLHKDFPGFFAELLPEAVYIPSCGFIGNAAPESAKINDHGFGTSHKSHAGQFCSDREFDEFSAVPAFWNEVYGVSPDEESSWSRYLDAQDVDRITNPILTGHSVLECQRNNEMLRFFDQYSFDAPEFRNERRPFSGTALLPERHFRIHEPDRKAAGTSAGDNSDYLPMRINAVGALTIGFLDSYLGFKSVNRPKAMNTVMFCPGFRGERKFPDGTLIPENGGPYTTYGSTHAYANKWGWGMSRAKYTWGYTDGEKTGDQNCTNRITNLASGAALVFCSKLWKDGNSGYNYGDR